MTELSRRRIVDRWPSALAVLLAGSLGIAVWVGFATPDDIAQVVIASGFVYLGAAAVQRRAAAWPLFAITFALIGIGFVFDSFNPSWWMIGLALLLLGYAVVRGALRPAWGVPLQSAAMTVLVVTAIIAASLGAPWVGYLVSAALLAHAGWDLYHRRTDRVVARSMTEFCGVLDTLLALCVLLITVTS